jgi:hypothetical protein
MIDGPASAGRVGSNVQSQATDPSMPARTTFQDDLTTAGQRKVNLIWEYTQAAIAVMVVLTTMIAGVYTMFYPTVSVGAGPAMVQVPTQIPTVIGIAFGMVTGFYFSRTNHAAIGGVGDKPNERYMGR